MNRRHPHTWRFYRRRYRNCCRRAFWLLALLMLGILGGADNGSLPMGPSFLQVSLLALVEVYLYSVAYGIGGWKEHGR